MPLGEPRAKQVGDWVNGLSTGLFTVVAGQFVESKSDAAKMYLVVKRAGGPVSAAGEFNRFELVFVTGRGNRQQGGEVEIFLDRLASLIRGDTGTLPCAAVGVTMQGSPVGPTYTAEDRAIYSILLELVY